MIVPIVLAVIGLGLFLRDPRRLSIGVLWLLAVLLAVPAVIALLPDQTEDVMSLRGWVVLGGFATALLLVLALTTYLLLNGVTMLRREQRTVANLLSLLLGLGMLGYLALSVTAVLADSPQLLAWLLLVLPPLLYVAVGFTAFLLYSQVYRAVARRRSLRAHAVIALGAGLIDGKVTPLLDARLRAAQDVRERCERATGRAPVLVVSGGQGPDEPHSEAQAMAERVHELGVPDDAVLLEDRSRNTEQNLRFSREVLDGFTERTGQTTTPVAVATSDYHAFRGALLLRRLGIAGDAVGGRTAGYYRPSAVMREYLAVMRDHRRLNVVMISLSLLPLLAGIGVLLIGVGTLLSGN